MIIAVDVPYNKAGVTTSTPDVGKGDYQERGVMVRAVFSQLMQDGALIPSSTQRCAYELVGGKSLTINLLPLPDGNLYWACDPDYSFQMLEGVQLDKFDPEARLAYSVCQQKYVDSRTILEANTDPFPSCESDFVEWWEHAQGSYCADADGFSANAPVPRTRIRTPNLCHPFRPCISSNRLPEIFRMQSQEMWNETFEEMVSLLKGGYSLHVMEGDPNDLFTVRNDDTDIYVGYDDVDKVVRLQMWPVRLDGRLS